MSIILKSGEEYTLSQLFSEDRKIIIPDLQRDYCWGDEVHGSETKKVELVSGFVKGLINSFNENRKQDLILGLIYGYENPLNHIHLCDGQQRITTLFLLLGMLHRKNNCDFSNNHLISSFEYQHDDNEPFLQYSIRESTLYFLSDLVCNFFIENKIGKVEAINQSQWYFNSYDEDPSIQSMLNALYTIEKELNYENDWNAFQNFIENRIKLLYYDLENRENGEDLFVIINTTGEPLTATENLKPILLGALSDNAQLNNEWETREEFFWKNKMPKEHQADEGLFEFISWYIKIQQKTNDIRIYNYFKTKIDNGLLTYELKKLHDYFNKFKNLIVLFETPAFENILSSIKKRNKEGNVQYVRGFTKDSESTMQQQNILLPLMYFSFKISDKQQDILQLLRRLRKNYFDKQWSNREGCYLDWRYILQIIDNSTTLNDVLEFTPTTPLNPITNIKDTSSTWFNIEEQIKTVLKKDISQKQKLEEWEEHQNFLGDISPLLKISLLKDESQEIPELINNIESYQFSQLEEYYNNYLSLESLMDETGGLSNPNLANYYRLFKVFTGCNKIRHVSYTTDIESVLFSHKNTRHHKNIECLKIFKSKNPFAKIQEYILKIIIKNDLFNISDCLFSVRKLIKAWLALKVFNACEHKALLAYHNGNGIGAHNNFSKNILLGTTTPNIENCICGYAVKSGGGKGNRIRTAKEEHWSYVHFLDTPIAGISKQMVLNRKSFDKNNIQEGVDINKQTIDFLIKKYVTNINAEKKQLTNL